MPRLLPTTITGPSIPFRDIAGEEGVGEPPGDVGAGAPGIDFGSLRADGNIHVWATLRESPNGNQPS